MDEMRPSPPESLDRELSPLREMDLRSELESAKQAVDRLHHQVGGWWRWLNPGLKSAWFLLFILTHV